MKRALYALSFLAFVFLFPNSLTSGNGKNLKTEGSENDNKTEKIVATFDIQSFKISKEGMVSWTSKNESGSLPFILEQYIFDKWVAVAKVNGIGSPTPNSYSIPVILNSGENKFRVKQKGYDKMSRFSDAVTFYSKKEAVNYSIKNKNQLLEFSSDTYFIVYNPYGAIVKQGYGNSLNISEYAKGYYCLVYDNKLGGFEKKKVLFKNTFCPIEINTPRFLKKRKRRE
ncbi:MAG: hypothetical protein NTX97_12870 [Bacteroidetes bacterium]|nr:hypothetical protein [Bacteroidota bacterium]